MSQSVVAAGVAALAVTYFLYPAGIRAAAWLRRSRRPLRPPGPDPGRAALPMLTVVVPTFNEADFVGRKLDELSLDDYPADRLELMVVDDGSTDGTADLAAASGQARVLRHQVRCGKSAGLNDGVRAARGEIVVFTDANASLTPGALASVAREFADPRVAVTTGAKRPVGSGAHGGGESLYWRLEAGLMHDESTFGSVMGADGGIYAVRRSTFHPIPDGVYADDYWLPLDALQRGYLVTQAPGAIAIEAVAAGIEDDFERRTRIAAGIWGVSLSHLGLADPRRGVVAVSFVCHRLLRSIVTPALVVLALPAAAIGRRRSRALRWLWRAQLAGWICALLGATTNLRPFTVPAEFALVNVAALRGGLRHLSHRQSGLWAATARGPTPTAPRPLSPRGSLRHGR